MMEIVIHGMRMRTTAKTHPYAISVMQKMHGCTRLRAEIFCMEVIEDAQTRRVLASFRKRATIKWLTKHVRCTDEDLAILAREGHIRIVKGKVIKCGQSKQFLPTLKRWMSKLKP